MKLLKENIIATRPKTSILITGWKILVTILFVYIFHHGIFQTSIIVSSTNTIETLEDPLPKLGSDDSSWVGLSFDQSITTDLFLSLSSRAPRSISNSTAYLKRIKRQLDIDEPSTMLNNVNQGTNINFEHNNLKENWLIYLMPMLLKIVADACCFYMGRLACKLCMQRICFALPITLVTPLALTILLIMCSIAPNSTVFIDKFLFWTCYADYAQDSFKWQVICGLILWWLSELWIGGHIWFSKSQRLAFTER
jgi:hypothetical protein